MPRKVSSFKVGLFILVCGTLGLTAVIWLGASHYFEETKTYVSYFDESVKGLQKDAVINFRGVAVGRAAVIRLAPDGRLIEVLLHLKSNFLVDKSLAIQLREQGLTGMRYLEIDTAPENLENLTPSLSFPVKYPLIASYPSEIQQLKSALEAIYIKITSLDLQTLTNNWTRVAEHISNLLAQLDNSIDPQVWREASVSIKETAKASAEFMGRLNQATSPESIKRGFQDLNAALAASRQASETLSKQLKKLPPDALAGMAQNWNQTLASGAGLFSNTDQHMAETAQALQQSLQQLQTLLSQLNTLAQSLKEQPNRLVFPSAAPNPFTRK